MTQDSDEKPKLLEGEVEFFFSLFEMGRNHDISMGVPVRAATRSIRAFLERILESASPPPLSEYDLCLPPF